MKTPVVSYSLLSAAISLFILSFAPPHYSSSCKAKQIAKSAKSNISPPYKYDSYAVTEIVFDEKTEKKVFVNFIAFQGIKYRVAFLNSGFEEAVSVNIYDKPSNVKNRKKLYDSSQGIDNNYWVYDTSKSGKYYIEYIVPKSETGSTKTGCIVMLIGFANENNLKM